MSGLTSNTGRSSRLPHTTKWKSTTNNKDTARVGSSHAGKKRTTICSICSNTTIIVASAVAAAAVALIAVPVGKRRRSAKTVHSIMVRKQQHKEAVEFVYSAVMNKIRYEREHLPEKDRQSVVSIVEEVNRHYDTSLTPETTRRRLKLRLESIPPRLGRGGNRHCLFQFQVH